VPCLVVSAAIHEVAAEYNHPNGGLLAYFRRSLFKSIEVRKPVLDREFLKLYRAKESDELRVTSVRTTSQEAPGFSQ
jgi:hypothetical protein